MSRKLVTRSLPPLADATPGFRGFPPECNRTEALADVLRRLARDVRGKMPRPFYAIREVATHFRMSPGVVGRVYQRLDAEGLLTRIRASMTLVTARSAQARIPVRGVVGLPIWLPGFTGMRHWQQFFVNLEKRLRYHHYLGDFIFTRNGETANADHLDNLLAHEIDTLFWLLPLPQYRDLLWQLADHGIHVYVLTDRSLDFPGRQFSLTVERALRQGFTEWRQQGVSRVVVVRPGSPTAPQTSKASALTHAGLPWQDATVPATGHREFVHRLAESPAVGIILDDDLLCLTLFYHAPQEMMELARKCRMLVSQSLSIPFAGPPNVGVDTVTHDWPDMAHRIADELALGANPAQVAPVIFHGRWRPQVPVNDLGFPHDGVARA